jgi:hypothetical protein
VTRDLEAMTAAARAAGLERTEEHRRRLEALAKLTPKERARELEAVKAAGRARVEAETAERS